MRALPFALLYILCVCLPLIFSWAFGGPPRPLRHELASGLGILAFAIILVEFVLSGRFKTVTNVISMDVTMRIHQVMARTALAFALLHPLLYRGTAAGGFRPWDPTRQLSVTTDFSDLLSGIAAYLLLPTFVLLAIGRSKLDYKYETWRLMHGLGALLIAGLLLHHTLEAGRYATQPEIAWLWVAMTATAVATLVWVYLLVPLRDRNRRWRVASVVPLSPRQWRLTLSPEGHAGLNYKAGQFAWLNVGHSSFSLHENPFSIASAPSAGPDVEFVIKEFGDFTRSLGQIEPGTRAYLDGAFGSLTVDGRPEPGIALIAGGVGIAPLIGIMRELKARKDPRKVRLVYGNRIEEQILFRDEIATDDVTHVVSEPDGNWAGETGVIDAALLDRVFSQEEIDTWLFVICGPPRMMDAVEDHLIARGAASSRILSEKFFYD